MQEIERDTWYVVKSPTHMRLDSTYRYVKIHSKERAMWVLKCFSLKGVDWMSYTEENLLYNIQKGFIVKANTSEVLDATIIESRFRR